MLPFKPLAATSNDRPLFSLLLLRLGLMVDIDCRAD